MRIKPARGRGCWKQMVASPLVAILVHGRAFLVFHFKLLTDSFGSSALISLRTTSLLYYRCMDTLFDRTQFILVGHRLATPARGNELAVHMQFWIAPNDGCRLYPTGDPSRVKSAKP